MTAFIWETKATPFELPPLEEIHEMKWKRLQAIESLEIFDHSKYVNSGWLVPKGQEQVFPGSSTSFTVTLQKAGTYHYICQLHPWMRGFTEEIRI